MGLIQHPPPVNQGIRPQILRQPDTRTYLPLQRRPNKHAPRILTLRLKPRPNKPTPPTLTHRPRLRRNHNRPRVALAVSMRIVPRQTRLLVPRQTRLLVVPHPQQWLLVTLPSDLKIFTHNNLNAPQALLSRNTIELPLHPYPTHQMSQRLLPVNTPTMETGSFPR